MTQSDLSPVAAALQSADVGAALRLHATSRPDATALTMLGGSPWSYRRLDRRARAVAAALSERCAAGDRVLLVIEAGPEFVAAFFGCLYAGLVPVPLAYRANAGTAAVIRGVVLDARPRLAIVSAATAAILEIVASTDVLCVGDIPDDPAAERLQVPGGAGRDLAFLQYTSGSTAAPRGVLVSHRNLLHNIQMIRRAFRLDQDSTMLSWLPHHHDMGLIGTILTPVVVGFPTVLMTPVDFVRQPAIWLQAITDYRATISGGPNFAYDLCTSRIAEEQLEGVDLRGWRVAFNGAEPVRDQTIRLFAERFAAYGFDPAAVLPCYGLAEATLLVAGRAEAGSQARYFDHRAFDNGYAQPTAQHEEGTVALMPHAVLEGCEVAIVDSSGSVAEDGQVGEIWLSGLSVTSGYWNQPTATELTFHARHTGSAKAYLRTGDLGFRFGDELYIRGRLDDVIIIRGRNVHPEDVENALRPVVGERVAVFGIENGKDEIALAAAYEVGRRTSATHRELVAQAQAIVASRFGVELSDLVPVRHHGLPTTTSGKLRRGRCATEYAAGILPRTDAPGSAEIGPEPSAKKHTLLMAAELSRLKGEPQHCIDPQIPLSGLGLDSLKAIEFQLWLERSCGIQISLSELAQATLAALAERALAERSRSRRSPAGPATTGSPAARPTADGLSYGQQAIWLQEQLAADASCLVLSRALEFTGPLDTDALRRALDFVMTRHAVLRTRISERNGRLCRDITQQPPEFDVIDVASLSDDQVQLLVTEHARRPLALDSGCLLRAVILRQKAARHVLVLSTHHIAMDVWSLGILIGDLKTAYSAETGGGHPAIPASVNASEYGEFVAYEQQVVASSANSGLAARWRQRLGSTPAAAIPSDHARPSVRTFRGLEHRFALEKPDRDAVWAASARCGVSPVTFLCGSYAILLSRLCRQDDFVFGFVSAGRHQARFRDTIGYFVNALPVPVRSLGHARLSEFMRDLSCEIRDCTDDGELPMAKINDLISAARRGSRGPLITTCFAYQQAPGIGELGLTPLVMNHPGAATPWAGISVQAIVLPQRASYFDMSLYLGEHEGRLQGQWNLDADLFDAPTAEALADAYTELVRGACRDLDAHPTAIPLRHLARPGTVTGPPLTRAELAQSCAHNLVERQVEKTPEAPAVLYGDAVLTYRELNRRSNCIAHRLIAEGVGPEDRVGILSSRTADSVAAIFGVLKAGAAYVPLDPGYPSERLEFIAADAGLKVLLADPGQGMLTASLVLSLPDLVSADGPDIDPPARAHPDNAAYLVYTSGSTGRPNGVIGLHRGITNRNLAILDRFPFAAGEICCHKTAQSYFDSGGEIFLPLMSGVPTVVVPDDIGRDPARLVELLARHRVTRFVAVPSLLSAILGAVPDIGTQLAALRYCHSSGEDLPTELAARLRAVLPGCTLVNLYGASETSADATLEVIDAHTPPGTVGSALPGMKAQVLGPDGEALPPLVPGDIFIGGVGLNRGYAGHADLTAAKFLPDPYGPPGSRMFATGDRGRMTASGRLQYLGRLDDQVKIRGHRVELGEVDAVINAYPAVGAALTAVRDGGQAGPQLVTAIVVRESANPDEVPVRQRVAEWRLLYERLYSDAGLDADSGIWTSSLTGEPFSQAEIEEWVRGAASAIRSLEPRRVLEIGCGGGNLLFALIDSLDFYAGTDFSPTVIRLVRDRIEDLRMVQPNPAAGVDVRVAEADAELPYSPGSFDVVVVNSVTQYLPGHDYVLRVLRRAVEAARPGGTVFVGDVRDLALSEVFHQEVARTQLGPGASAEELAVWARNRMRRDKELLLSADFFLDAARLIDRVSSVDVRLKAGRYDNELIRYRYDVLLQVAGGPKSAGRPVLSADWPQSKPQQATAWLQGLLQAARGAVEVKGVPNGRLGTGFDPAEAEPLARRAGYVASASLATSREPSQMDLRFWPQGTRLGDYNWSELPLLPGTWPDRASHPLADMEYSRQAAEIREHARRFLPPHAIPVLEIVDEIPTTDTGKLSRRRVGQAIPIRASAASPQTMLEKVSAVWREELGRDDIPPEENFFDLGGHSLSLVRVHVRLQELLSREFPLVDLYEHTTAGKLAAYLEHPTAPSPAPGGQARPSRAEATRARRAIIRGDR